MRYSHVGARSSDHPITGKAPHRCEFNSSDGSILVYTTPSEVLVMTVDADGGEEELCRLPMEALDVSLSPTGRHLATFCSPPMPNLATGEPAATTPNLFIWRLPRTRGETAREIASFLHRKQNNWNVQWTSEENFFARLVQNQVCFYRADDASKGKI